MASETFPYRKALIIGATSGIGQALAERFVRASIPTVVVGRRQANLDAFVSANSTAQVPVSAITLDIASLSSIPAFAARIAEEHPDLDFVLLNAGIQRGFDFAKPESVDLGLLAEEFTTNYTAYVHLTMALLPLLQRRSRAGKPSGLAFTSSGLALAPILECGNYCAIKAALHSWILVLREQLRPEYPHITVIEILPPAVQTELHDPKNQPHHKGGASFGMPLKEFTDLTWAALNAGQEQFTCGPVEGAFKEGGWEMQRQAQMKGMCGWLYPNGWKGLGER